MKHVIIGTAGHVDHGKTTLIQALTGTNPDRLKEEQERGMTIDIGFAALRLPDGSLAGIVDVPGHERFLKNMLAGAGGVDVALLVIAGDESVMPQTREHLDILRLLDVRNGVVALTKADLVDREWMDAVEEDVRSVLEGTFLASSPLIRVSSVTGKGLEALKRALLSAVSRAPERNASRPFRLPIDRVFTRPGFGTVVTGTLVSGTIRIGDSVEVVPQRLMSRVRGLQVHGQKVTEAIAGSRVAVNLVGVETDALSRGAQLAPPHLLKPTLVLDAVLQLLPELKKPLKDRARVRLHIGAAEVLGRVRLLDVSAELPAGGKTYIQFRAETEFVCAREDRFVIRTYSPMATIGGGWVLDAAPARHRKADPAMLATLSAKERGTPEDLLATLLERHAVGALMKDLPNLSGLPSSEIETAVTTLLAQKQVIITPGDRILATPLYLSLTERALAALDAYHLQFPLRVGIPKEELRAALGKEMDTRAFSSLLNSWQGQRLIQMEGATVRKVDFEVALNERQQALLGRIERVYLDCGIAVPTVEEVGASVKAPPDAVKALLQVGVVRGRLARVQEGVYYHTDTLVQLQKLVAEYVEAHGTITVAAFRDLTGTNRKFALLAMEYFDQIRFTRRSGDERVLYTSPLYPIVPAE